MCNSEFEELEAVPTSAAIDGPLEPQLSSPALVSDAPEESLVNYFNVCSLHFDIVFAEAQVVVNSKYSLYIWNLKMITIASS